MRQKKIEINIDELILNGFSPNERYDIGESMEHELMQLFSEQGIPPQFEKGGEIGNIDGGEVEILQNFKSNAIGEQIARTIYRSIKK
jgi:hypothetical protein